MKVEDEVKDEYADKARELWSFLVDTDFHNGRNLVAAFGRECAAGAFRESAKESLESQIMVLTHENIEDGMLDDGHPVIVARRVMRENISRRLLAKAATLCPGKP